MKVFSIVFISLLTGCSVVGAVYDTNEYTAFANVANTALQAKELCGEKDMIKYAADSLKNVSSFAVIFTKHEPYNSESYKISQEIDKLVSEFRASAKQEMSEGYCNIKLNSIQHAAEVAMEAATSKRRQ